MRTPEEGLGVAVRIIGLNLGEAESPGWIGIFYFFTFFFVQEAFLSNFFTRFLDGRAVWWSTVGLFCYRPSLFTLLGAGRIGGHECSRS